MAGEDWTFKELDQAAGLPKGSAFRAFKSLALVQGRDFQVLTPAGNAAAIAELKRSGRVYASSITVVLLTAHGQQAVTAALSPQHHHRFDLDQ